MIRESSSTRDRLETTGILKPETARDLGVVGIAGRASGFDHDLRRDFPHAAYDQVKFTVPVYQEGDVLRRMQVRIDEVQRVALASSSSLPPALPEGPMRGERADAARRPRGARLRRRAGAAKSSTGFAPRPGNRLARCKVKDPSLQNWPALSEAILGNIVPDFPVVNKSFNLSYSGTTVTADLCLTSTQKSCHRRRHHDYPQTPAEVSSQARGRPEIDLRQLEGRPPCRRGLPDRRHWLCEDGSGTRTVTLDLGKCTFCGLCAEADPAIRMTNVCELAASAAERPGDHAPATSSSPTARTSSLLDRLDRSTPRPLNAASLEAARARNSRRASTKCSGRSLHIREVDAGSCNGCEIEIVGLNSPVYDIERFGIHFVASPRHADMLLVTGPVTRNMELALRKTYDATPDAAPGRGGGRLRLQRRHLRPELRHPGRRGQGHPGGCLYPRLPAQSPRPAARHSAGHRPPGGAHLIAPYRQDRVQAGGAGGGDQAGEQADQDQDRA